MRVSIKKSDRGYRHGFDVSLIRVYLDGKLYVDAITADEELGEVTTYARDTRGHAVVSEDGKAVHTKIIKGSVRIVILGADGVDQRTPRVTVDFNINMELEVLVYSRMQVRQARRHTISVKQQSQMSLAQIESHCSNMAGAGAEYCCSNYADMFDPSEAARLGGQLYKQLLARTSQLTRH